MTSEKQRSALGCFLAGCGVAAGLGILTVVVLGVLGYRSVKRFEAEMEDPAARTAKVAEILGAQELPPGYHAMVGLSIPFFLRMAILTDQEPGPEGEPENFRERGFIYLEMLRSGEKVQALEDFLAGRTEGVEALRDNDIDLDLEELVGRGEFTAGDQGFTYASYRGTLRSGAGRAEGLTTLLLVDCPQDRKMRLGIWFGPDPDPEADPASLDVAASVADPAAIQAFLGHFQLCGG